MQSLVGLLLLILVPYCALCIDEKYKKYISRVSLLSIFVSVFTLFGVLTDVSFKWEWLNILCFFSVYTCILFFIIYVWKWLKNKMLKIIWIILVCAPFVLVSLLGLFLSMLGNSDSYDYCKTLDGGRFKVRSYVEFSDNMKESVVTKIYQEISYLPFLEYLIYDTTDMNQYIEKTEYNNGRILIYRSDGSDYPSVEKVKVDR